MDSAPITYFSQVVISMPAVSANDGALRYVVPDKCGERFGVAPRKRRVLLFDAGDNAEPEAASISEFLGRNAAFMGIIPFRTTILGILARPNLDGSNYRHLMMNSPSFTTRAPANATFVHFDGVRRADGVAVGSHHSGAKFVKHSERCLVSGNVKLALKLDSGLTWRLRRHEVGTPKPGRERHVARLHDRPGGERRIFLTGTAAQDNRRAGCETIRLTNEPALRARKAIRPAHWLQVTRASAIIREDALKLRKTGWEDCVHG